MNSKLAHLAVLVTFCCIIFSTSRTSYGSSLFDKSNRTETLPPWLYVSASHRTRYETLTTQFRSKGTGGDQQLAIRTLLAIGVKTSDFSFILEGGDSRAFFDDTDSPISTTMVNPAELIQGYLMWEHRDLLKKGDRSSLQVGRLTLDVASRRLVARSKFRNTTNTFSGAEWKLKNAQGNELQLFYTLPINRSPKASYDLKNNHIEFDTPSGRTQFWGISYTNKTLLKNHQLNLYGLRLDEKDSKKMPTANRKLFTAGFILQTLKEEAGLNYLLESVYQFGESRKSTKSKDEIDLEHFAHFHHAEIGFSWRSNYFYKIGLEYDYASGDSSNNDNRNGRFDSLFGARRFDYGPTGIYGPFKRSNLNSIGLRVSAKPSQFSEIMSSYRGFWRASKSDGWVGAGISAATNIAPRFMGQQLEVRLRWKLIPQTLHFELGSAYLRPGKFAKIMEPQTFNKNIYYGYAQVSYLY
jgi:hypothetical protein